MEIPGGDRFLSADCHHQEVTNSDLPGFCKIEVQRGNNMMVVKCSKQRQAEMIQNLKEIISPIAPKYNLNLIILYGILAIFSGAVIAGISKKKIIIGNKNLFEKEINPVTSVKTAIMIYTFPKATLTG